MIDRAARDRFSQGIRALAAGLVTNDEFEDTRYYPLKSADRAISAIYQDGACGLYADEDDVRLIGARALSREDKTQVARWVLFLKTDLPYEWPMLSFPRMFALSLANLVTLGLAGRLYSNWCIRQGEPEVWPFIRDSDYTAALERPVYLKSN